MRRQRMLRISVRVLQQYEQGCLCICDALRMGMHILPASELYTAASI